MHQFMDMESIACGTKSEVIHLGFRDPQISSYVLEVLVIRKYLTKSNSPHPLKFYHLKTSDCHCTLWGCTETKMKFVHEHPGWRGSET